MAIDAADVDASKGPFIRKGTEEWEAFFTFKRGFVGLEPEIRKAFPNDKSVNDVLKKVLELKDIPAGRKKSA